MEQITSQHLLGNLTSLPVLCKKLFNYFYDKFSANFLLQEIVKITSIISLVPFFCNYPISIETLEYFFLFCNKFVTVTF